MGSQPFKLSLNDNRTFHPSPMGKAPLGMLKKTRAIFFIGFLMPYHEDPNGSKFFPLGLRENFSHAQQNDVGTVSMSILRVLLCIGSVVLSLWSAAAR